jgi:3-hydroxyisobutyrate dehydrogenase
MCGGSEATFERAKQVLSAYCGNIVRIGEAGAGQLAKMVNQIAIAGVVQGLAEAVSFAKAQELDTDAVLAAISKGAAGSWQMENRWATMVEDHYDFGFAVDWMRKDLRIVLEAAQTKGLDLALTQMVDGYYAEIQADGGGRLDTSSLAKRFTSLRKPD